MKLLLLRFFLGLFFLSTFIGKAFAEPIGKPDNLPIEIMCEIKWEGQMGCNVNDMSPSAADLSLIGGYYTDIYDYTTMKRSIPPRVRCPREHQGNNCFYDYTNGDDNFLGYDREQPLRRFCAWFFHPTYQVKYQERKVIVVVKEYPCNGKPPEQKHDIENINN